MPFWSRKRPTSPGSLDRPAAKADAQHLEEFVRSRRGVEGFIEPATTVTSTTLLLVAHDGEWTRRRVPDAETGLRWCRDRTIPVYDAGVVGYPQRMRDWSARQRRAQ